MRQLILALVLASSAFAQVGVAFSFPLKWILHPKASFQSSSGSLDAMFLTDSILQTVNVGDYATTYTAFTGANAGRYCENNPLLVTAPCVISMPRFRGVKIAVLVVGVAEWFPVWAGKASPTYIRAATILNGAATVPLSIAVIGNLKALHQ